MPPFYAADGGTVTLAGWYGGLGYCVKIDHGNGTCHPRRITTAPLLVSGASMRTWASRSPAWAPPASAAAPSPLAVTRNGTLVDPLNYLP